MAIFSGDGIIEEAEDSARGVPAGDVRNARSRPAGPGTLRDHARRHPHRLVPRNGQGQTMSKREEADEKPTRLSQECLNQAA